VPVHDLVPLEDGLGDPLTVLDSHRRARSVPHRNEPLVWVVGVDRAWRIGYQQPLLEACATSRADLGLEPVRKPRAKAEWDERHGSRSDLERPAPVVLLGGRLPERGSVRATHPSIGEIRPQVEPCRASGRAHRRHDVGMERLKDNDG
jgi:hypothetical protein